MLIWSHLLVWHLTIKKNQRWDLNASGETSELSHTWDVRHLFELKGSKAWMGLSQNLIKCPPGQQSIECLHLRREKAHIVFYYCNGIPMVHKGLCILYLSESWHASLSLYHKHHFSFLLNMMPLLIKVNLYYCDPVSLHRAGTNQSKHYAARHSTSLGSTLYRHLWERYLPLCGTRHCYSGVHRLLWSSDVASSEYHTTPSSLYLAISFHLQSMGFVETEQIPHAKNIPPLHTRSKNGNI